MSKIMSLVLILMMLTASPMIMAKGQQTHPMFDQKQCYCIKICNV